MNDRLRATQPLRPRVSPFARKLARQRSVALGDLTGSGPQGRIVAADVLAFRPNAVAGTTPAPAVAEPALHRLPMIFSALVSTDALSTVIARAAAAGVRLELVDIALRSALRALAAIELPTGSTRAVTLEAGERQLQINAKLHHSVGHSRRLREQAERGEESAAGVPAVMSLHIGNGRRVAQVPLSPLPGRAMRLSLQGNLQSAHMTAHLCCDPDVIPDEVAARVLEAFACALEAPLALLA